MVKIFITFNLFQSLSVGEYCICGNFDKKSNYFVNNVILYQHCSHTSCLNAIMKKNSNEFISFMEASNFASGDLAFKPVLNIPILIFYEESNFVPSLKYCDKYFQTEIGPDFTFLMECLFKNHSVEPIPIPNSNYIESTENSPSRWKRLLNNSYVYRFVEKQKHSFHTRNRRELVASYLLEISLSILLICVVGYQFPSLQKHNSIEDSLVTYLNSAVSVMQSLLTWLMGVPVGLKLNQPLSRVLGHFYLFHIGVWHNYMDRIIMPLAALLLSRSGLLLLLLPPAGLSLLLAVYLDLLNLVTIHLSCFYIYACRLYRLQVLIVASLYRLFHGKKWNPLRSRVDSGPLEMDRLFVSTLLLTSCLFLVPTCLTYYCVFAAVQLCLLAIEFVTASCLRLLLDCPVLSVLHWLVHHPRHKKMLTIEKQRESADCLVLSVELLRVPFSTIFAKVPGQKFQIKISINVFKMLSQLVRGLSID